MLHFSIKNVTAYLCIILKEYLLFNYLKNKFNSKLAAKHIEIVSCILNIIIFNLQISSSLDDELHVLSLKIPFISTEKFRFNIYPIHLFFYHFNVHFQLKNVIGLITVMFLYICIHIHIYIYIYIYDFI